MPRYDAVIVIFGKAFASTVVKLFTLLKYTFDKLVQAANILLYKLVTLLPITILVTETHELNAVALIFVVLFEM